jgi:arsenite methyltransferase
MIGDDGSTYRIVRDSGPHQQADRLRDAAVEPKIVSYNRQTRLGKGLPTPPNNSPAKAFSMTMLNVDLAVRERYAAAAQNRVPELCCPVDYDVRYLDVIPQEILDRDYGCGDPSKHLQPGETVLDLGSGGGKICYIAAQVVGPSGRVIGVDCNDEMLLLARTHPPDVARRRGYDNVEFRQGRIQDLKLDLDRLDRWLRDHPVTSAAEWRNQQAEIERMRREEPLIADGSIDVVISNCVLNLVDPADRRSLFAEMFRVLKPGGRAVISDITSDRDVPLELQRDANLWSGCISGAHREDRFLAAFAAAGFVGTELLLRQDEPWATVQGIEFRSVTVRAFKPVDAPPNGTAEVIYRGPWRAVEDDAGQRLVRGQRISLTTWQARQLSLPPYCDQIVAVGPNASSSASLPVVDRGSCCGPKGCC